MSVNLPTYYSQQFATNIQMLLQQKESRLSGAVMSKSYVGKSAQIVDQVGAINALKVTQRFAPMGRVDAATDARWVSPVDYDLPQLIDSFDKLKMLVDPTSVWVQNGVAAMNRAKDNEIISAFFGSAKTGADGSTSTAFASGQIINVATGASAAAGLNVAKLRAAKKLLMANEVDPADPIYCAITAAQHDNLLAEAQIINLDFNDKPVLVDGSVTRFLGINFIHTELLQTGTDDASGTSTAVPVWAKSGMHLGMWQDIMTDVSQRKDIQSLPYQAYLLGSFGASRVEEKKICKIWCR